MPLYADAILTPPHRPRLVFSGQRESVLLPALPSRKPSRLRDALLVGVVAWVMTAALFGAVALGVVIGAAL